MTAAEWHTGGGDEGDGGEGDGGGGDGAGDGGEGDGGSGTPAAAFCRCLARPTCGDCTLLPRPAIGHGGC